MIGRCRFLPLVSFALLGGTSIGGYMIPIPEPISSQPGSPGVRKRKGPAQTPKVHRRVKNPGAIAKLMAAALGPAPEREKPVKPFQVRITDPKHHRYGQVGFWVGKRRERDQLVDVILVSLPNRVCLATPNQYEAVLDIASISKTYRKVWEGAHPGHRLAVRKA